MTEELGYYIFESDYYASRFAIQAHNREEADQRLKIIERLEDFDDPVKPWKFLEFSKDKPDGYKQSTSRR